LLSALLHERVSRRLSDIIKNSHFIQVEPQPETWLLIVNGIPQNYEARIWDLPFRPEKTNSPGICHFAAQVY
jgi:hypothetical protein